MKKKIHPKYQPVVFDDVTAGRKFLVNSTLSSDEKTKWEDGKDGEEWWSYLDEEDRIAHSTGPGSIIEDQPFIETWENGLIWWRCPKTKRTISYNDVSCVYRMHAGTQIAAKVFEWSWEWAFRWLIGEEDETKSQPKR